ncbi:ATP/GTP-binding protein [Skermania sp. ID1734]|uniref:ATP/GTP-binding protein n=1 Tax=Skermania sp. ID1734 TaxID=2597516 RepID=UPI00117D8191|nr:ATP/GTP-binding protein [Skermania sp. ID1734]TSD93258.1 ATP/GTP-binding protein [Skermania sp. ID1734]
MTATVHNGSDAAAPRSVAGPLGRGKGSTRKKEGAWFPPPRRPLPKRRRFLDRHGWYEPRPDPVTSTTRQTEALHLAMTRRPSGTEGIVNGVDATNSSLVCVDQFTAYGTDVTNINVALLGSIGVAKTSNAKTIYAMRQMPLGRQVVSIDRKRQSGRGEYGVLADAVGAPSIRFTTGANVGPRLNLLDPQIALRGVHDDAEVRPAGQTELLYAVLTDTMGRALSEIERAATANALRLVTDDARRIGREPVIGNLAERMMNPQPGDFDYAGIWSKKAQWWGRDVALALRRLSRGELAGLVDAPTSADVREALTHPFVHFDVCDLPDSGPALRVVMTVINTWLANRLAARSSRYEQTELLIDEGWHVADGSTGALFRANMKLSRGLGLSTVSAFHHISDFARDSPARALMQESSIVYLYRQERADDAAACAEMFQLPAGTTETLMSLGVGQCLLKIGTKDPILMRHIRSPLERAITNSDAAIKGIEALQ